MKEPERILAAIACAALFALIVTPRPAASSSSAPAEVVAR